MEVAKAIAQHRLSTGNTTAPSSQGWVQWDQKNVRIARVLIQRFKLQPCAIWAWTSQKEALDLGSLVQQKDVTGEREGMIAYFSASCIKLKRTYYLISKIRLYDRDRRPINMLQSTLLTTFPPPSSVMPKAGNPVYPSLNPVCPTCW